MDLEYYVYHWSRPDTGEVFYVGKGKGSRDTKVKGSTQFVSVLDDLKRVGVEPVVTRVFENLTEQDAFDIERSEIARIGRREFGGPLVNLTSGGQGISGRSPSVLTRVKIGAAHKGKVVSPETRAKISAANSNRSPEVRARLGAARRGMVSSAETRAKVSAALRKRSPEIRARVAAANSNPSPETRARRTLAARMAGPRADNTSGFKGVSFDKLRNKWLAKIFVDSRQRCIGLFDTPLGAARAYDAAAYEAWGDGCYLNLSARAA